MMTSLGGLYEGFEGYRTPTEEDLERAVQEALVVVDANVLLKLYNYQGTALDDFMRVFEALGDRLYVPHQALEEFWRNRLTVLKENQGKHREGSQISEAFDRIERDFRSWFHRVVDRNGEPPTEALQELEEAREAVLTYIERQNLRAEATTAETPTHEDHVLRRLDSVLAGHVGPAPTADELRNLRATAERRVKEQVPPGYLDAQKSPERAAGDFMVWNAAIEETKTRSLPLLLVTDDLKDDWWARAGIMPRPELAEELQERAGQTLRMMRSHDLVGFATAIGVEVSEQTVDQAEAAGESDSASVTTDVWTLDLAKAYLWWLSDWPEHHSALMEALRRDGRIARRQMARILRKDPDVGMKGAGRPYNTALARLEADEDEALALPRPFSAIYDGGWMTFFQMPSELVPTFQQAVESGLDLTSEGENSEEGRN